ncbi:FadR/GntR family transcriptional regulator [Chitinophaga japonensis]|uniref:Transcriptional regulator, GntR family n=1 Tax=Chitinophaga japonensis TaxID=104662 RepID=A0A562TF44_CHIJA|nr:FCD domain-containing protein [Chitinophaga japonensis]TWI92105.1 transcriptional regulator, GntR family [Chitinophaga japonensis]
MMSRLPTIKRHSLADAVAQRLQQQISLGQYQPDDKLPPEPALMQEFGVGRSTIREAVRILANAGVLRVQQGLGTFVETPSDAAEPLAQRLKRAELNDLVEVRQLLELKIAQKAAMHRTGADIEKMRGFLQQRSERAQANDVEGCIQADIDFHISIAAAAQNAILADLYSTVARHLKKQFTTLHTSTRAFLETQHLHQQLLQSIIDRQPEKAWQSATRITEYQAQKHQ